MNICWKLPYPLHGHPRCRWVCFYTQLFTSQDINCWTGVVWIICGLLWCFYQLFGLSFWRHPFTAEHPLVSKWWMLRFSKSVSMKKQTHLHLGWPEGEYFFLQVFIFGWTIPLKTVFFNNNYNNNNKHNIHTCCFPSVMTNIKSDNKTNISKVE